MTDEDPLTVDDAAALIGVPVHQLLLWAWQRVGPRHVGTRVKPRYREEDLQRWVEERSHAQHVGETGSLHEHRGP